MIANLLGEGSGYHLANLYFYGSPLAQAGDWLFYSANLF
jgi:hypothetical protein